MRRAALPSAGFRLAALGAAAIAAVALGWWALSPDAPTTAAPPAKVEAWWPADLRYHEAAVRTFGEDLVAEGHATEVREVDCAEYPCLVHVSVLLPKDGYADLSVAMSYQDAEFVRREREAGYLPGGTTSVLELPEGWAVSHVTAALAQPLGPDGVVRLDTRIERMLASP